MPSSRSSCRCAVAKAGRGGASEVLKSSDLAHRLPRATGECSRAGCVFGPLGPAEQGGEPKKRGIRTGQTQLRAGGKPAEGGSCDEPAVRQRANVRPSSVAAG